MNILSSSVEYKRKFGAIFTPLTWAKKIVEKHFFKEWLQGATILDPTAGEGVFIEAFIEISLSKGITLSQEYLSRLFGIELSPVFVRNFYEKIQSKYAVEFPRSNFLQGDILFQTNEIVADFLVGNPPWVNFTDLEESYKEKVKSLFVEYGLVTHQKDLLLGNARTDIASLILFKVLYKNLKAGGKAIFFVPLSIFQNDGANQAFRNYQVKEVDFCVKDIMDCNGLNVFEDILGRYGIVHLVRNQKQEFPIKYHIWENQEWKVLKAKPLFNLNDPLTILENENMEKSLSNFPKIVLPKSLQPRQGVNTCGANEIFFFNSFQRIEEQRVLLQNKAGESLNVSLKYVYPLVTSSTLTKSNPQPEKLILIPHDITGKPAEIEELQQEKELWQHFLKYKSFLENRKGVLINSWIKKGYWWSLLGIGEYSFRPYKIMWRAFGESRFEPVILLPDNNFGSWQGNQSLNAFIATQTLQEAQDVLEKLKNPLIQQYLSALRMQGTCNWANPDA